MDDILVKLRCAACNRLATNAFRTPCCDQSICENCQSSLPQACPICLHEPVKAEDCRPNKTLRTTIRAFLKKIATEREKAQKKQESDKAAANPVPAAAESTERTPSIAPTTTSAARPDHEHDTAQASQEASNNPDDPDDTKQSMNGETATEDRVREESFQEQAQGDGATVTQQGELQQPQNQQNLQMQGVNGAALGFDGMNNGFPNMAFNNPGDFNAMMQFMPNNAMGAFPNMMGMPGMPGMPGIGMDPVQAMSQGMFGGLGGQNMGMNGMNGMNAGMGFPAGQGWNNGGFNGQPGAWMSGQDKFNQNAYGGGHANGMMGGDFGANAGYAGYNMASHQGNFNQMNHHQFPNHDFQSNGYHGQGFHNRGRGGRGRGYGNAPRGRGGYNQVMNGNHTNHEPFHHQHPQHFDQRGNSFSQPSHHPQDNGRQHEHANPDVDDFGRIKRPHEEATDEQIARQMAPGDADESPDAPDAAARAEDPLPATVKDERSSDVVDDPAPTTDSTQPIPPDGPVSKDEAHEKEKPAPIKTFVSDEPLEAEPVAPVSATASNTMLPPPSPAVSQPPFSAASSEALYEYGYRGRGGTRRLSRGSSDFRGAGRGRGASSVANGITNHVVPPSQPSPTPVNAPTESKGVGVIGAPKGPKAMREGLTSTATRGGRGFSIVGRASVAAHARTNGSVQSRSRSPTKSRSPSRHRSHHHRSHRHRSTSPASAVSPDREERRRERHRRRSRKYQDEDEEMQDEETKDSTTRRSSHRSSRRDRDEDREEEEHNKEHRTHRSRRDRDRDRDRKRSRTPTATFQDTNGVVETSLHSSSSSRKRHERHDEDDEARRQRKRSRRDRSTANPMERSSAKNNDPHTSASKRDDRNNNPSSTTINAPTGPKSHRQNPLKGQRQQPPQQPQADIDPHELERQARNKERLQKELQRREAMEGYKSAPPPQGTKQRRESKNHGGGGRRVNYKFEDELEGGSRVEREREGARWG
ncbi:MAG: hypothetical protein Q9169_001330 [Polycauliona sp. 2 TL-2023]